MPSARDNVSAIQTTPTTPLPPLPKIPEDVKKRFPSMQQWEARMEEWRVKANNAVFGTSGE